MTVDENQAAIRRRVHDLEVGRQLIEIDRLRRGNAMDANIERNDLTQLHMVTIHCGLYGLGPSRQRQHQQKQARQPRAQYPFHRWSSSVETPWRSRYSSSNLRRSSAPGSSGTR